MNTPARKNSLPLSDGSLSVLRGLLGRSVHQVYASNLQVAGSHIAAPSFSIPVSDELEAGWLYRYVVGRCEWFETPEMLNDYWQLLVMNEGRPDGIQVHDSGAIMAPCTVNFYGREAPITKIDIFAFSWPTPEQPDAEIVAYDRAVLFKRGDGSSFCIFCQLDGPGIATDVHLSENETIITDLLKNTALRLTITQ